MSRKVKSSQKTKTHVHPLSCKCQANFYKSIARITKLQKLILEEEKHIHEYFTRLRK